MTRKELKRARETGAIGGAQRAKNLTAAKRKKIAKKAAAARWGIQIGTRKKK